MKCKVCKFVISLPIVSNTDGEVVCEACFSPTVSTTDTNALSPTDESILTSVLLAIPRECRYKDCPTVIIPGDDHKVWCGFQETSCKLCDWVGASRDIGNHATSTHQLEYREMGESVFTRNWETFDPNKQLTTFTPVVVGSVFLWVVTSVDPNEKEFRNNYIAVPNGNQATKVFVEIIFGDESSNNVNAIKKELTLNPIFSTSSRNSIVFPTSVLDDYIYQNNVLQWKEVFSAEA